MSATLLRHSMPPVAAPAAASDADPPRAGAARGVGCGTRPRTSARWPFAWLGRGFAAWERFWLARVPAHSLAAFRILFGLYFLAYFLSFAPHVLVQFSDRGITVPYLIGDWALPPAGCVAAYALLVATAVAWMAGWRTAWVTPLLLAGYLYFYLLNLAVKNTAYERLTLLLLAFSCFGQLDAVWSVRPTGRADADGVVRARVWPIRMITLQIAFLYFGAGYWKLTNPRWHTGDLLYFNFIGDWATPLAFWVARLVANGPVWTAVSWTVIGWELAMGFALFVPRLRLIAVATGAAFHLGVWLLLGIPEFLNCVAGYVLFFPPEAVAGAGRAWWGRCARVFDDWSAQ